MHRRGRRTFTGAALGAVLALAALPGAAFGNHNPPVATAQTGPLTPNESTTANRTYTFTFTDPDASGFKTTTTFTVIPACGDHGTVVSYDQQLSTPGGVKTATVTVVCKFPDGAPSGTLTTVRARVEDGTGNRTSATRDVTIQNVDPTVTLDGPRRTQPGSTETYTATYTDPGADSFVNASVDCGTGATAFFGTFTANGYTFSCTFPTPGVYTVSTNTVDEEGRTASATRQVIAEAPPGAPRIVVTDDTGASATDNVTKDDTPRFSGDAGGVQPGANQGVTVVVDPCTPNAPGDDVALPTTITGSGANTVYTTGPAPSLADGTYCVRAVSDRFGTTSPSTTIVIDTVGPMTSTPDLTTDTGASGTDNITAANPVSLDGSTSEPARTTVTVDPGGATGTESGFGTATYAVQFSLAPGTYTASAQSVDLAGNTGPVSGTLIFEVTVVGCDQGPEQQGTGAADLYTPGSAIGVRYNGLGGSDNINGSFGGDCLSGGDGADTITGGGGEDVLNGGPGNDTINAQDDQRDVIDCGGGTDVANVDALDVTVNCETVRGGGGGGGGGLG